jgi:hypothetical protein
MRGSTSRGGGEACARVQAGARGPAALRCGGTRCGQRPSDLRHAVGRAWLSWRQVSSMAPGPPLLFAGSSGLLARSSTVDDGCRMKDKDRWAATSGGVLAMVLERRGR